MVILVFCIFPYITAPAHAETGQLLTLQGEYANVLYPPGLESEADSVNKALAIVSAEVKDELGLSLDYRPVVIIITDR